MKMRGMGIFAVGAVGISMAVVGLGMAALAANGGRTGDEGARGAASMEAAASTAALAAASAAPESSGYHLIKKIKLGGSGGWDYIAFDSATRRLFISRGTEVVVVDVDSEKIVGQIPNTQGVHGIAFAPQLNRGFISDGRTGDVTIFDMKTLATIDTVKAGENPDAIIFDPSSSRVFAMNGRSKSATAIDAASGKAVGTVPSTASRNMRWRTAAEMYTSTSRIKAKFRKSTRRN